MSTLITRKKSTTRGNHWNTEIPIEKSRMNIKGATSNQSMTRQNWRSYISRVNKDGLPFSIHNVRFLSL